MSGEGDVLEPGGEVQEALAQLAARLRPNNRPGPVPIIGPIRTLLAAAGYPPEASTLFSSLLQPAKPSDLRAQLRLVLDNNGLDRRFANDVAAMLTRESDEIDVGELLRIASRSSTAEDSCASVAAPSWLEDPRFAGAYAEAKGIAAWGREIRWRVQTLVKLAAAASHLEGDFVECGVDTGGTARAVMAYLGDDAFADRTFYLFDTFRGLVSDQLDADHQEGEHISDERYPDVSEVVRANFADKPFARIVQGTVPETLDQFEGSRVAYLHIDMNVAHPEVEALRFFWPMLVPGAPVVFDDYGFPPHHLQRTALDEVARELGVEIMMLPTCQGLLIRPPDGGA